MAEGLAELRRRIDECDEALVRLINERLKVCQEVGEFKTRREMEVRIPEREREVISKALDLNEGPCPPDVVEKIFRLLIDTAVALEEN
jgi:chorismate mutase/prephenate dehydratase